MTQINLPPSPDLPPIPTRGIHGDITQHATPPSDRIIVNFITPSYAVERNPVLILDDICRLLCSEITSHASRHHKDTRDQAAYHIGWHDAIHSLRRLTLSLPANFADRTHIDGVPLAPRFHERVPLSDATNMLMSASQPLAMTTSREMSPEERNSMVTRVTEVMASLVPSASTPSRGLFSTPSAQSRRARGPCSNVMKSLNQNASSDCSSLNSSHSSSTPFNTPSTSTLSSPIDSVLGDVLTAPRDQPVSEANEANRLNQSKIIKDIDTTNLLMLYEREARLAEHRIIAELAKSNILRQSILQDRFFGNVPSFNTDAIEVEEFGAEINEPFVGASQQKSAIKEARETFEEWSYHAPSYEGILQPSSSHPPETRRQLRARATPLAASTRSRFRSSDTSGAGSGKYSNCPSGGGFGVPREAKIGMSGVSSDSPSTDGLFGNLSAPKPAHSGTSRETKIGTSGGLFGNLSAPEPAPSSTSRETEIVRSGVSSSNASSGGLFGRLPVPTPLRSSTSRETEIGTSGLNPTSSSTGVVWGGLYAPLPAHLNPAKDTDIEREIRAESIVCGPTMRTRVDKYGTETCYPRLLPHLPFVGGCKPQPVARPRWEKSALPSKEEEFGSNGRPSCRRVRVEDPDNLHSLRLARTLATNSMPEHLSPFGEPKRNDFLGHQGSGFIPVSSTPVLGNVTNPDTTASQEPVELPASTRFDRHTSLPEPDSAEYAANSVKPLFSQISSSDASKSPPSHPLRSRRGEIGVNPLINLQTATRPLPSQRPVAASTSRCSPSMSRSELAPAGISPPTSLLDTSRPSPSLLQMPGQFPIQQESQPVPLVQVPADQSEKDDGDLPKIVLTSANSSDEEEDL